MMRSHTAGEKREAGERELSALRNQCLEEKGKRK